MSGFSEDAVDALTTGKDLNVVLIDKSDIEATLQHGFGKVLRAKLRAAAEEGIVFYPFTSILATAKRGAIVESTGVPTEDSSISKSEKQLTILCEGIADIRILNRLGQRIIKAGLLTGDIRIVPAQGKLGIPRLADSIYPLLPEGASLIAVVDGDGRVQETEKTIHEQISFPINLIVVNPGLEAWFEPEATNPKEELRRKAREARMSLDDYVADLIERVNLNGLIARSPSFQAFHNAVTGALRSKRQPGKT
jgi:hypothetical protein